MNTAIILLGAFMFGACAVAFLMDGIVPAGVVAFGLGALGAMWFAKKVMKRTNNPQG